MLKTTADRVPRLVRFLAFLFALGTIVPISAQQLIVGTNGNTITWSAPAGYCCAGASLDEPFVSGADCSVVEDCSTVPAKSGQFFCNPVATHVVFACWYNTTTAMQCDSKTVDVTDEAPPTCPLFDLVGGTMVLTHKYGMADSYPPGQTADAQMTLKLRARKASGGTSVYLRVLDPPDTSGYGTPHQADDNEDPNGGTFSGSKTTQVSLTSTGSVQVVLSTSDHAAGDNYRVEATADPAILSDPNFVCATDCNSLDITVWKRAYYETDNMFRHGAVLTQDAAPLDTTLSVSSVSGFRARKGQTPGSEIMLVHASRVSGQPAYFEPGPSDTPITVETVDKKTLTITLSRPIANAYQADLSPWLSDGVGVITGVATTDYYVPNASLLSGLLAQSFVDLMPVAAAPGDCGCVPFYPSFTDPALTDLKEMANLWSSHRGESNTFHLLSGVKSGDNLGERPVGTRDAWVYVGQIETKKFINQANLNGEVASHEFTHAWDVNGAFNNGGHCDQFDYSNTTLKCLMRPGSDWTDVHGSILPEYYDGHVGLHFKTTALDISEYLDIRRHTEPLQ